MIAQALGWNYLEMDFMITNESGKTVAELTNNGASWQEFRELETSILEELLEMENVVISAGGGVGVNNHVNRNTGKTFGKEQAAILKNHPETAVFVLTADTEVIANRLRGDEEKKETVQRPLLNEEDAKNTNLGELSKDEHIEKIISDTLATWKERKSLYEDLSDSIIDTSTASIKEAAFEIVELLKK